GAGPAAWPFSRRSQPARGPILHARERHAARLLQNGSVRGFARHRAPASILCQPCGLLSWAMADGGFRTPSADLFLDGLEIGRFGAACVRHHVERNLLAFVQRAQARRLNSSRMDEYVLAAAFRRDEAKALCGIEELHGSDRHFWSLSH